MGRGAQSPSRKLHESHEGRGHRLFYHSVKEKSVVGIVEVVKQAYSDPTDPKGKFVCVDFKALRPVKNPVSLADIKANPKLETMALLRQSRLSVMPVADDEWDEILTMAGGMGT